MTSPHPTHTTPGPLPKRAFDQLLVVAEIAQQQFAAAQTTLENHPLSPKAHMRVHTLTWVVETLAALITMFASVGAAAPRPKAKRPAQPWSPSPKAPSATSRPHPKPAPEPPPIPTPPSGRAPTRPTA